MLTHTYIFVREWSCSGFSRLVYLSKVGVCRISRMFLVYPAAAYGTEEERFNTLVFGGVVRLGLPIVHRATNSAETRIFSTVSPSSGCIPERHISRLGGESQRLEGIFWVSQQRPFFEMIVTASVQKGGGDTEKLIRCPFSRIITEWNNDPERAKRRDFFLVEAVSRFATWESYVCVRASMEGRSLFCLEINRGIQKRGGISQNLAALIPRALCNRAAALELDAVPNRFPNKAWDIRCLGLCSIRSTRLVSVQTSRLVTTALANSWTFRAWFDWIVVDLWRRVSLPTKASSCTRP